MTSASQPAAPAVGAVLNGDVSPREQPHADLPTLSAMHMMVLNASTDAAVIIDVAGRIVIVNKTTERMFGYAAADLVGRNVKMLMPEPYASHHDTYIDRYNRTHVGHIGVGRMLRGLRANGDTFEMFLTLTEIKDEATTCYCGFVKNISNEGAGSHRDLLETSSQSEASSEVNSRAASTAGLGAGSSSGTVSQLGSNSFSSSSRGNSQTSVNPRNMSSAGRSAAAADLAAVMASPLSPLSDEDGPWYAAADSNVDSSYWTDLTSSPSHDSAHSVRGTSDSAVSSASPQKRLSNERASSAPSFVRKAYREINMAEVRFVSQTPLGKGAFGVVFAGEWRGVKVAVKKLMGYVDDQMLENMRSECALMHKCSSHPNIVKFIGAGNIDNSMCIVTQYCSNGSVFDAIITRGFRFSPRDTLRILRDAALGVMHLHKESVVHRDIAARNVLLDEFYNVYLCDFGLARVKTQAYHHTKSSLGPVKYLSPEAISKKQYSFASDMFAFGVLMWEMTHCAEPYADQPIETFEIAMGVVNGTLRLAIDDSKALGLGDTMRACWRGTASERPLFDAMVSVLNARLSEHADPSHSLTRSARVPASRGELATIAEESAN